MDGTKGEQIINITQSSLTKNQNTAAMEPINKSVLMSTKIPSFSTLYKTPTTTTTTPTTTTTTPITTTATQTPTTTTPITTTTTPTTTTTTPTTTTPPTITATPTTSTTVATTTTTSPTTTPITTTTTTTVTTTTTPTTTTKTKSTTTMTSSTTTTTSTNTTMTPTTTTTTPTTITMTPTTITMTPTTTTTTPTTTTKIPTTTTTTPTTTAQITTKKTPTTTTTSPTFTTTTPTTTKATLTTTATTSSPTMGTLTTTKSTPITKTSRQNNSTANFTSTVPTTSRTLTSLTTLPTSNLTTQTDTSTTLIIQKQSTKTRTPISANSATVAISILQTSPAVTMTTTKATSPNEASTISPITSSTDQTPRFGEYLFGEGTFSEPELNYNASSELPAHKFETDSSAAASGLDIVLDKNNGSDERIIVVNGMKVFRTKWVPLTMTVDIMDSCIADFQCPNNAKCRPKSCEGYKCLCRKGYVASADKTKCFVAVKDGGMCDGPSKQCVSPFATCLSGLCSCYFPYFMSINRRCTSVFSVFIGEKCEGPVGCFGSAQCIDGICKCEFPLRPLTDTEYWDETDKTIQCIHHQYFADTCNGVPQEIPRYLQSDKSILKNVTDLEQYHLDIQPQNGSILNVAFKVNESDVINGATTDVTFSGTTGDLHEKLDEAYEFGINIVDEEHTPLQMETDLSKSDQNRSSNYPNEDKNNLSLIRDPTVHMKMNLDPDSTANNSITSDHQLPVNRPSQDLTSNDKNKTTTDAPKKITTVEADLDVSITHHASLSLFIPILIAAIVLVNIFCLVILFTARRRQHKGKWKPRSATNSPKYDEIESVVFRIPRPIVSVQTGSTENGSVFIPLNDRNHEPTVNRIDSARSFENICVPRTTNDSKRIAVIEPMRKRSRTMDIAVENNDKIRTWFDGIPRPSLSLSPLYTGKEYIGTWPLGTLNPYKEILCSKEEKEKIYADIESIRIRSYI